MMNSLFWAAALFLGTGLGFVGAWLFLRQAYVGRSDYSALALAKQGAEAKAEERRLELEKSQTELKAERAKFEQKAQETQNKIIDATQQAVRAETENKGLQEKIAEGETALKNLEIRFENLANRIFQEKTNQFRQDSETSLGQLLLPLKGELEEFRKNVANSFGQHANEQYSLKKEIEKIVLANKEIVEQAGNLTRALKGDTKIQGNWGEVILEKILEESGLRKGVDYVLQGEGLAMVDAEGVRQKPDAVVMLPENRHIIIDAKVTLTHYERYFNATNDMERAGALKQFLASVRAHVQGLEQRRYQKSDKLETPDFVLMFLPIEGAFTLAIQQDQALHAYAWDRKIAMVGPTTLFVSLRTIASLWRIMRQEQNAQTIAQQAGDLYDKIVALAEDMLDIGKRIDSTKKAYEAAYNKLAGGRGNILGRIEKLKILGAKTSKAMPSGLINYDDSDVQEEAVLDHQDAISA